MTETTPSSSAGDEKAGATGAGNKGAGRKAAGGKTAGPEGAGGKAAGEKAAGPEGAGAVAPVDLSELLDDMVAYGRELLDRVADKTTETASLVRERSYDADAWMKDVNDFWDNVRKDAVRAAEYWRDKFPAK